MGCEVTQRERWVETLMLSANMSAVEANRGLSGLYSLTGDSALVAMFVADFVRCLSDDLNHPCLVRQPTRSDRPTREAGKNVIG